MKIGQVGMFIVVYAQEKKQMYACMGQIQYTRIYMVPNLHMDNHLSF